MTALPASTTASHKGDANVESATSCVGGDDVFERRLIDDATAGCDESYRILVERHQIAIFRFCLRILGCVEDAKEAGQDTFVRAHERLSRFKFKARFSTWLFAIALNHCRDILRYRARKKRKAPGGSWGQARVGHPIDAVCHRPEPDECLSLAEDLKRLYEGIEILPPRLREAIILTAVEGLSHVECTEVLGCSVRAVEGRVHRARKQLLDWLNQRA